MGGCRLIRVLVLSLLPGGACFFKLAGLSRDYGRGAPPAMAPSYERYLASTGYLKRLTRHRQRCLRD
jgi:hypothetical protein